MKTRFAPSPTGFIHLGNARAALLSWLFAQQQQGIFLLRIEDTDHSRSSMELGVELQNDLKWLGLEWGEGPDKEQSGQGPYFQSQRQAIYDLYYEKLNSHKFTYLCFCSDEELQLMRKIQLGRGQPPRYNGACRHLSPGEIAERIEKGEKSTLRFIVPDDQTITFMDLVKGPQKILSHGIGDFIIRRTDGTAPFFFCNALDDALMGITHVLRGEDHLSNTPRQILILESLDLPLPAYGHLSLIVGSDGRPLSKRNGSSSLKDLRKKGYFPGAIQNYLARLGHHYAQKSFLNLNELAIYFSIKNLGKAAAQYEEKQLVYWQKQAILAATANEIWSWLGKKTECLIPFDLRDEFIELVRENTLFPEEGFQWAQVFFNELKFSESKKFDWLITVPEQFWQTAITIVEEEGPDFNYLKEILQNKFKLFGKDLFKPLRFALTGLNDGPQMGKIFALLGKEKILSRFKKIDKMTGDC